MNFKYSIHFVLHVTRCQLQSCDRVYTAKSAMGNVNICVSLAAIATASFFQIFFSQVSIERSIGPLFSAALSVGKGLPAHSSQ